MMKSSPTGGAHRRAVRRTTAGAVVAATAVAAASVLVALGPAGPVGAAIGPSVAASDLSVVSWGSGALGDGVTSDSSTPIAAKGIPDGVVQISAGSADTLALTTRGEVWAWGDNFDGELGDGTTTPHQTPEKVPGITGAIGVAAGNLFSLVLLSDGTAKSFGTNRFGQLGVTAGPDQLTPITVPGLTGATALSAGGQHSLALRGDGSVWAWGFNGDGELGNGGIADRATPAPVPNLINVLQIVAQEAASVARLDDGSVWVWGEGSEGELGNGLTTRTQTTPTRSLATNITSIAGGDLHTLALRSDGTVWAWGMNLDREVNPDAEFRHPTPSQIAGLPAGITQVAASRSSSLALDAGGHAWTWGRVFGNPPVNSPTPFQTPGLAGATTIVADTDHYAALVKLPAYSILATPGLGSVAVGGTITTSIGLTPFNGYGGSATLAVSALPAGVTATFSSPQVGATTPDTLTLHTSATSPVGIFPITVTGTDNTLATPTRTAGYLLSIAPAPSFAIALNPASGSATVGGSVTSQVILTATNGYTGSAALSVTGLPAGASASFSAARVSAGAPSTLTVQTTSGTPTGAFPITVTATDPAAASPTKTATYQLTVAKPTGSFTISLSEPFGDVLPGGSATTEVDLVPIKGFTGSAKLSVGPLQTGLSVSFSSIVVNATSPVQMTVHTTSQAPTGTWAIEVIASGNGVTSNALYEITIEGGTSS